MFPELLTLPDSKFGQAGVMDRVVLCVEISRDTFVSMWANLLSVLCNAWACRMRINVGGIMLDVVGATAP
jgi:hypothetical protein